MNKKKENQRKIMILLVDLIETIGELELKVDSLIEKTKNCSCAIDKEEKPLIKKTVEKKEITKEQKPLIIKTVEKKEITKEEKIVNEISESEKIKRDEKRSNLQKKTLSTNNKVSISDIKKIKMIDIYGVGPKIEAYFLNNKIKDIFVLSHLKINEMTESFIDGLPALKSVSRQEKFYKLESIIEEADFLINLLTDNNKE